MRYLGGLAILVLLANGGADAALVPLPAKADFLAPPGFLVKSPGSSWYLDMGRSTSKDGSAKGEFLLRVGTSPARDAHPLFPFNLGRSYSTAVIEIAGSVFPITAREPKDVSHLLLDGLKKKAEMESKTGSRTQSLSSQFSEVTVNGAACARWDTTGEDRAVPGHEGKVFALTLHSLLCSDPEFPAYIARVDYSTRIAPGEQPFGSDAAGLAALDSLTFQHLGYRVTQIEVGKRPQGIAAADGAIWVAYGAEDGKVARIDPKTDRVVAVVPVGRVPVAVLEDGNGSLWVANSKDDTVSRIDSRTNTLTATFKVPGRPLELASGAGSIWVAAAGAGSVARIDTKSNAVTELANIGKQPAGMAFVDGSLYVSDYSGGKIVRIDPASNVVVGQIATHTYSNWLVADGHYLWLNDQSDEPAVLRLDLTSPDNESLRFANTVDYKPTGVALWNGKLWVANWAGASVSVLDPQRPDGRGEFLPTGAAPFWIRAAEGALWVTVLGDEAVLRFDPD